MLMDEAEGELWRNICDSRRAECVSGPDAEGEDARYAFRLTIWSHCCNWQTGYQTAILAIVTCVMEGSMYAMVFFWPSSIERVRPALAGETPYGIVFADLMAAM